MKRIATALFLTLAMAGTAFAQPGPGKHKAKRAKMMEKFDANGDGVIDDAERAKAREARKAKRAERHAEMLRLYDTNRDGTLDDAERAAMRTARRAAMFNKLDANGDGVITRAEFDAAHEARAKRSGGMKVKRGKFAK